MSPTIRLSNVPWRWVVIIAVGIAVPGWLGMIWLNFDEASLYLPGADTTTQLATVMRHTERKVEVAMGTRGGRSRMTQHVLRLRVDGSEFEREVRPDLYAGTLDGATIALVFPVGHPERGFPASSSVLWSEIQIIAWCALGCAFAWAAICATVLPMN